MATSIAICGYNDKFASIMQIIDTISMNLYNMCPEIDSKRAAAAQKFMSYVAKNARMDSRKIDSFSALEWLYPFMIQS